jgi:DNA-directed RNA polymerase subunit alpha
LRLYGDQLSLRSANCLKQAKIHYIGDLVRETESDLLRIPGPPYLGRKSINELKEILAQIGLHFGMEVPGWPPKNIDDLAKAYEAGLEQLATDASG